MPAYTRQKRWERLAQEVEWEGDILELRRLMLEVLFIMHPKDQAVREAMIRYYDRREVQRPGDPEDSRFLQWTVIGRTVLRTIILWEHARDMGVLDDLYRTNDNDLISMIEGDASYTRKG